MLMATKIFCDHCEEEITVYHGPLIFKMASPETGADTSVVFHELCPKCFALLKRKFRESTSSLKGGKDGDD